MGWDHIEAPQKHESQVDHKIVSRNDIVCSRYKNYYFSEKFLKKTFFVFCSQNNFSKKLANVSNVFSSGPQKSQKVVVFIHSQ